MCNEAQRRRRCGRQQQQLTWCLVMLAALCIISDQSRGAAVATVFPRQNVARLRLRGGAGSLKHLLPEEDSSDESREVVWSKLTEEEKKEFIEGQEVEKWQKEFIANYSFANTQPPTLDDETTLLHLIAQEKALRRKLKRKKLNALREHRGPMATFEDEHGEQKTLIDELDPDREIPREMIKDDSSEEVQMPDPKNREALLEFMFNKLLDIQRRNEDDGRFADNEDENLLNRNTFAPIPDAEETEDQELFRKEIEYADHVIDAPYVDEDGNSYNINCSEAEFLAQHGIFEVPLTTPEAFEETAKEFGSTASTALEAWEMFKGKDLTGFDSICLRHKRWGTEVEFFIGSRGMFKTRPSPYHQITQVEVDGSWFEWKPNTEEFDAPHIFEYMWSRHNVTDVVGNAWREGGRDWLEAMGGADAYLYQEQEAEVAGGAELIDIDALQSERGWVPCQDRWADFDLLNTTYIRPGEAEDDEPLVRQACENLQGSWRARAVGPNVVWTNKHSLCELHLTPEGFVFLSDWDRWKGARPRAVRVEYGMAGCVKGVNVLHTLPNDEARRLLGLSHPAPPIVDALKNADKDSIPGKLLAWCSQYGWHDLKRRLFSRGRTAAEVFEDIHKETRRLFHQADVVDDDLPYTDLERDIYTIDENKRKVKFLGVEPFGLPRQIVDVQTRDVIWDRDQDIQLQFPWATEGLRIQQTGGGVTQIFDKFSGRLLVEMVEVLGVD